MKALQRLMEHFIGCDAHKKFSVFASINEKGEYGRPIRVGHEMFREFLKELPAGSKIAVDEMERAGHVPHLAHALTASGGCKGGAKPTRNGTLPVVWIPPAEPRDQREMLRWRMCLSGMRTRI